MATATPKDGKNIKASARARTLAHVITTLNVIGWFNYSFKCDWLIELSDNKVSNNKLSNNSEWVKNRSFLNQSQSSKL